jgi:hypothetical protein
MRSTLARSRDPRVPAARLVKVTGVPMAPWRLRGHARQVMVVGAQRARPVVAALIGLWPLTATALVAAALLWAAGFGSAT